MTRSRETQASLDADIDDEAIRNVHLHGTLTHSLGLPLHPRVAFLLRITHRRISKGSRVHRLSLRTMAGMVLPLSLEQE